MAVEIIIKRKVKQGYQARQLVPLLLELRTLAMKQPGYISGESLCDLENPGDCLVISRWESESHWNKWKGSVERTKIDKKIMALTGVNTQYNVYSSMTPIGIG